LIEQTTIWIKKEVDTLKKILFLIIASLLVIGLVVPGCEGEGEGEVGDIVFEEGVISIGIAGELSHMTGQFQLLGATMASSNLSVDIDGEPHSIALVEIETGEATVDPLGSQGYSAMLAKIDQVDFVLGGYRTEAVTVYREVAMENGVIFVNCGAATEFLQHSVVDNYTDYKYWFKHMPSNEYSLADSVMRMLDAVGRSIRIAGNFSEDYTLRAGMIADDAVWCDGLVTYLETYLSSINVDLATATVRVDPLLADPTAMGGLLAPMVPHDPHFVIPILSADAGVVFAAVHKSLIPTSMSVGINVPAQFKLPWTAGLADPNPANGAYCAFDVHIDTFAEEVAVTSSTLPFLAAFMAYAGDYPLYTATTYDALLNLVAAIESEAWYDETTTTAYANVDDIIAYMENQNPALARPTTTGKNMVYPQPGTTVGAIPALSEAQVLALYPHIGTAGYPAYNAANWTMPIHTTHDLVTGPDYMTGVGCQWQWDAGASLWKKFGVWPMEIAGADLKDQYGDWNFAYPGTKALILVPGVAKP
jgi:branched-chain amino acid transport system substrate-binding protein